MKRALDEVLLLGSTKSLPARDIENHYDNGNRHQIILPSNQNIPLDVMVAELNVIITLPQRVSHQSK